MLFSSLRLRIVGVAVATLAPCLLLVGIGLWKNYTNDQETAAERVRFHAHLLATRLDDRVATIDALLAGIARAVSTSAADGDANDKLLRQVILELPPYVGNVKVFALDGSDIGTSAGIARRDLNAHDRTYFQRILAGDAQAVGEPLQARTDGRWIVNVARPINDAAGRLQAVIAAGLLLDRLGEALGLDQLPPDSAVEIINEDGIVVSGRGQIGVQLGIKRLMPVRTSMAGEVVQPLTWSDDLPRITGMTIAHHVPWVVAVGLPMDAAFSAVRSNLVWGSGFSLLAFLSALALAFAVTRLVARPLGQIGADAAILASGNLSHRSTLASQDEIGRLAGALNQMAESLEEWQAETNAARDRAAAEASERRQAEELERQAKETLGAVVDASPVAIVCSDPRRNIVVWSRAAEQTFGYTSAEVLGLPTRLVTPEGLAESQELFGRALAGEHIRGQELKRRHRDGTLVDVRVGAAPIYDRDRKVSGVAWAYEDITEQKRTERELNRLAHFDQLTGLPNRVSLQTELTVLLGEEAALSVALVDLDGFKHVNDTLGHSTGDQLLVEVGRRLLNLGADGCRVFRLGGDEFVVMIKSGDPREIDAAVDGILHLLAQPFELNDHVLHLGGSIGIAIAPNDGTSIDELLGNADLALYDSKAAGGRSRCFFRPVLRAQARSRRELEQELRRAFEQDEFELFFQPQLRLSDQALVGAEALLRWRHPSRGLIGPGAFIEALDENAIAPAVGKWILHAACAQLAAWRQAGLPLGRIAVNLFPIQVNSATLMQDLEEVLAATGLTPDALDLEITEKSALDYGSTAATLEQVYGRGFQVSFDDFGTGYASLSSLTQYPLTRIKIDRSFVANVSKDAEDAAIVRSLIMMAHNLGLSVTAEGVETEFQADYLRKAGCDDAQGFLWARPLPAHEFEEFMATMPIADAAMPAHRPARRQPAVARGRRVPRRTAS
jgi:diguanylate cyclase (GGDEF)-like protein/PAS domain S-box-containing protein